MNVRLALFGAVLAALLPSLVAAHVDGITLVVSRGTGPDAVELNWTGGQPIFRIYRSTVPGPVIAPENLIGESQIRTWADVPGPGGIFFYEIASPCLYNPPEICDGLDNDCNGDIDGPGSELSCDLPNAVPACTGGSCVIAACVSGFDNCDLAETNGCEANLAAAQTNSPDRFGGSDVAPGYIRVATIANCGACGVNCDDGIPCTTDLCVPVGGVGQCRNYSRAMCAAVRCATDPFMVMPGEGIGDPECSGPDSDTVMVNGTSVAAPDGRPDAWETAQLNVYTGGMNPKGVDINCDGIIDGSNPNGPDLELPDSDPGVPDVYVAYDYMNASGSEASHKPLDAFEDVGPGSNNTGAIVPGVIDRVTSTFTAKGIALHMSVNVNSHGVATSSDDPFTTHTPHKLVVTFCPDTTRALTPDAITFESLKAANFDRRHRFTHRYAVFAHFVQCAGPGDCDACTPEFCGPSKWQASGMAEMPGNDMIVSLGGPQYPLDLGSTRAKDEVIRFQTGTFVHELGHTIGLNHGGAHPFTGDACLFTPEQNGLNYKPNYLSVMNYRYQFTGITMSRFPAENTAVGAPYTPPGTVDGDPQFIPLTRFDFSPRVLRTLNETLLDEYAGVSDCASTGLLDIIKYNPSVDPAHETSNLLAGAGCGPVDWNKLLSPGIDAVPVMADTNRKDSEPLFFDPVLAGFDDWTFVFNHLPFQCTVTFSEGAYQLRSRP